jgi:metal-sulfur cluster biosynthetic enzyme
MAVSRDEVLRALRAVFDPELRLSIVDLGLVYDIAVDGGRVRILMTLTGPGCPLHDTMRAWVERAVGAVSGVEAVDVAITFDPPWTPDRITTAAPR